MPNSKNRKTDSKKEIDKLFEIATSLARVDTKVSVLDEKLKEEISDIKQELLACSERLACIETSGAKTIQVQLADLKKRVDDVCDEVDEKDKDVEKRLDALEERNKIRDAERQSEKEKAAKRAQKYKTYGSLAGFVGTILAILTFLINNHIIQI